MFGLALNPCHRAGSEMCELAALLCFAVMFKKSKVNNQACEAMHRIPLVGHTACCASGQL